MLTEEQYLAVVRYSEGAELHFLWLNIEEIYPDFDQRKEAFFWVLKRLLEEGRARLASGGDYMKGTADEQIEVLRRAFPDSRFEMAKVMEKPSDPVDVDLDYLWFISDDCPVGIVWPLLDSQGKEYFPKAQPLPEQDA